MLGRVVEHLSRLCDSSLTHRVLRAVHEESYGHSEDDHHECQYADAEAYGHRLTDIIDNCVHLTFNFNFVAALCFLQQFVEQGSYLVRIL